jgi:hypothetical protein
MSRFLGLLALVVACSCSGARAGDPTGCHGTTIDFVDTPREAAVLAQKEEKLVLILHISGHFEDPGLT